MASDVTIFGAGIIGLAIGLECAERGARVQVVDPGGIGAGASGGLVGALAPHTPENWNTKKGFQFDSLLRAERMFAFAASRSGLETGYIRSGRLQAVQSDRARALGLQRQETAETLWKEQASWRLRPASDFGDWVPGGCTEVIYDTLSALVHPRRACQSIARAITAMGGQIVRSADPKGEPVVWATGVAGLYALGVELDLPIGNGVKGQAALLEYDARGAPQIFADGVHVIPHLDGTVAIGSTSEREFDDPATVDGQLDALLDKSRALVPVLSGAKVLERWAGVRPRAATRAPLLGLHPLRAGHFIANGGFKIGFGMAAGIARVMADLVLDGRDTIPDDFSVETCLARARPKGGTG